MKEANTTNKNKARNGGKECKRSSIQRTYWNNNTNKVNIKRTETKGYFKANDKNLI